MKIDLRHLSDEESQLISRLIQRHTAIFATEMTELGRTNVVQHTIPTTGEAFALQPYRTPITLKPLVKQQITDMLNHKIIRPSTSPYRSPVVLVKKKTGEMRFCIDYRRLNSQTIKDQYPLPRIDDTLDLLYGAKYFSTIDLFSGYWQVEIAESDKHKTAFTSEFGHYEFNRMPFGLCNAPSTFQRLMENVLKPIIGRFALVYIDDVIIYSATLKEHEQHIDTVFQLLSNAGLKIKLAKCSFAAKKVEYLGHIVSADGISPDEKKLKAVKDFPEPKNVDQVRSFVGLASYYRRFIMNFSEQAHALTQLTRKNVPWQWGATEQSAFNRIKKLLTTAPILGYPDISREFIIHTDASGYGIGAVLSQMQSRTLNPGTNEESKTDSRETDNEVVIAYTSKHLTNTQVKWSTTEKEAYAIVHAIKTFYHYLYGSDFTIVTDHRPLEFLMSKKEPTGRLARWSLFLQPFNLHIKYRPGKSNQNADCLSRIPVNMIKSNKILVQDWIDAQKADSFCKIVLQDLTQPNQQIKESLKRRTTEEDSFQKLPNQLLATATGKIIVPTTLQREILEVHHDHRLAGHLGMAKTIAKIKAKYFWPRMTKDIQTYIRNCLTCAKRKTHGTCKAPMQPIPVSDYIWERIAMDIMGPLPESYRGNKYILVIMEYVTRYVIATPLKDLTANNLVRKFIKHVIMKEGIPSEILTDQGTNFQSSTMKELCKQLGIKQLRTTAYHPQTDGAVEKFNKTLGDMLTEQVANDPPLWDVQLDYCIACYNQTTHLSTNETPFYLLKGRDPLEPIDLRPPSRYRSLENENDIFSQHWHEAIDLAKAHLIIAQNKQKQNYDRIIRNCNFEKDQLVLLKEMKPQTGKFYMRWDGIYVIVDKLSDVNYLIRKTNSNTPFVVHVNRLKPWKGQQQSKSDEKPEETNLPSGLNEGTQADHERVIEVDKETTASKIIEKDLGQKEEFNASEKQQQTVKRKRGRPRKSEQQKTPTDNETKTTSDDRTTRYNFRTKTKKPTRF